jgi:monoamine oxidase
VSTPGTIPAHAVPPRAPDSGATGSTSSAVVASAADAGGSSGNLFGGLFASNNTEPSNSEGVLDRMSRFVGWKASDPAPAQPAPAQTKKSQPKSTQTAATTPKAPTPKATSSATPTTNAGAIRPAAPKGQTPEAKPEAKPDASQETKAAASAAEPRPSSGAGLVNGTQPPVPTGSFNNRWGSFQ